MSQWTHVNASIRFDGLLGMGLPTKAELGEVCRYEDEDISSWDDSILPCGSEGSIDYKIVRNPNTNSMAAMVVVFFGDLRDYSDSTGILEYFKRITEGKMIRSGILEIEVESSEPLLYRFDKEDREWVEL